MRKSRKVLIILGLVALAAGYFVSLRPRDEPKYHGRYLSEWLAICNESPHSAERAEAGDAVQRIGTNALPYFFKAMRQELPQWKVTLHRIVPNQVKNNFTVHAWLFAENRRAIHSTAVIRVLGTNAVSALPELKAMMKDRNKPRDASLAIYALGGLGEPAIAFLQLALADQNQLFREQIIQAIEEIARHGHTNTCLPILRATLNDANAMVRSQATNTVKRLAPGLLLNTPAN